METVRTGPNKDLLQITRIILKQNSRILDMNERLLRQIGRPHIAIDPKIKIDRNTFLERREQILHNA